MFTTLLPILKLYHNIPPINPNCKFKVTFDFVMLMYMVFNVFVIPARVSWQMDIEQDSVYYYILPIILFTLDSLLTFNTGFYFKGVYVSNKKQIFVNYVRNKFQVDLFIICIDLASYVFSQSWLQIFTIVQLLLIPK